MDITTILDAINPDAHTSPEQGTKLHNHTLHVVHEIIKGSQYCHEIARWHRAMIEMAKPYCDPCSGAARARTIERKAVCLVEAVCTEYCLGRENRVKKRTVDEVGRLENEEEGIDSFIEKCRAKVVSIKEMAETGLSFKLDWNRTDKNVTIFKVPDEDVTLAESKEHPPGLNDGGAKKDEKKENNGDECFDKKENRRPISSPHSLRKKLLRKLLLTVRAA
ncbi:hypothetical protein TWF506_009779 [Arthrobotrys conoides]|uniref:Uncharacterized protein n=1 Tax=Arthrobotrys conoides TaxID=74498 RepID=A0AAN8NT27_9PEZI